MKYIIEIDDFENRLNQEENQTIKSVRMPVMSVYLW